MQVAFFGEFKPLERLVAVNGVAMPVVFRFLDNREVEQIGWSLVGTSLDTRLIRERRMRIARSILTVQGDPVDLGEFDPEREMRLREEWAATIPGPVLVALSQAYEHAAEEPITLPRDWVEGIEDAQEYKLKLSGRTVRYFGEFTPIEERIMLNGATVPVQFALLDNGQEERLAREVGVYAPEVRNIIERRLRVARSLVAVFDTPVTFGGGSDAEEAEARVLWAGGMPDPLLVVLCAAYEAAAQEPITILESMYTDPLFGSVHAANGQSSAPVISGQTAHSHPGSGRLPRIIFGLTRTSTWSLPPSEIVTDLSLLPSDRTTPEA